MPKSHDLAIDNINDIKDSVLEDPMAIPKDFGKKRIKRLQKADPVLAKIQSHLQTPTHDALELCNPVLTAHLAYTLVDRQQSIAAELEKYAPNIPIFLCLYVALRATWRLSQDYEDAEKAISWYGEHNFFGPPGRPKTVQDAYESVRRLMQLESAAPSFPRSETEDLVSNFVSDDSPESWEKLQNFLINATQTSDVDHGDHDEDTPTQSPISPNPNQQPTLSSPNPNKPIQRQKTASRHSKQKKTEKKP